MAKAEWNSVHVKQWMAARAFFLYYKTQLPRSSLWFRTVLSDLIPSALRLVISPMTLSSLLSNYSNCALSGEPFSPEITLTKASQNVKRVLTSLTTRQTQDIKQIRNAGSNSKATRGAELAERPLKCELFSVWFYNYKLIMWSTRRASICF